MAETQSTNLKLDLVDGDSLFDTGKVKSNFEKIDSAVGTLTENLPTFSTKIVTIDVTNSISNGIYYTEKNISSETWYPAAKAIIPLYARKSGTSYICNMALEYGILRVQATTEISGVNVGLLVIS